MLQQVIMFLVYQLFSWMWQWSLPSLVWELLGYASRGIGQLISWTPSLPYAPYTVLSIGLKAWVAVYAALLVLSFVNFIFEWVRGK